MQMNAKLAMGLVSGLALIVAGCATTDHVVSPAFYEKPLEQVAVIEVSGDIRGDANRNQVSDFFAMEMMRKGYRVMERERVQKLMAEQDLQQSGRTSQDAAAQIGKLLNVPAVVMLDVNVSGDKLSLTGRMVDVDTGEVLWIGTGRSGSGRTFARIGGAVGGALLGSQVGGGRGRSIAIGTGGVLGGAAGDAMAPQTARVVQRTIKQMVEEIPDNR